MISRLTAFAAAFSVSVATAFAISAQAHAPAVPSAAPAARTVRIVELPRVVVVAHRLDHGTAP